MDSTELFKRYTCLDLQAKKIHNLFGSASPSELLPLAEKLGEETSKFLQDANVDWQCCGNLGRHLTFLVRYLKKNDKDSCLQDIKDIVFFDFPRMSHYLLSLSEINNEVEIQSAPKRHPQVFISYSRSIDEHRGWVQKLASKLRGYGVDVILDEWDLRLGDDIATFMERSITTSDRVLVVCSETYNKKVVHNSGGVAYEKMIVTSELVKQVGSNKFIPVIPPTDHICSYGIPTFLSGRLYIDLSSDNKLDGQEFQRLVNELHGISLQEKPQLGPIPFSPGG